MLGTLTVICVQTPREFVGEARKAGRDEHPGVLGDRGIYVAVNHSYTSTASPYPKISVR